MRSTLMALFAGLALVFSAPAYSEDKPDAPLQIDGAVTIDADKLIELVGSNSTIILLDNRKAQDFEAGRIEGAVRLLDTDINSEADLAAVVPTKETPVIFYCNGIKCGRAANAAQKAVGFGYTNVFYYALGMEEWKGRGLPMISG